MLLNNVFVYRPYTVIFSETVTIPLQPYHGVSEMWVIHDEVHRRYSEGTTQGHPLMLVFP